MLVKKGILRPHNICSVFLKSTTSKKVKQLTKIKPNYVLDNRKSIKKLVLTGYAIQFTGANLIWIIHTMKIRESTGIQCMFMTCKHNAGQNHNIKVANKS